MYTGMEDMQREKGHQALNCATQEPSLSASESYCVTETKGCLPRKAICSSFCSDWSFSPSVEDARRKTGQRGYIQATAGAHWDGSEPRVYSYTGCGPLTHSLRIDAALNWARDSLSDFIFLKKSNQSISSSLSLCFFLFPLNFF